MYVLYDKKIFLFLFRLYFLHKAIQLVTILITARFLISRSSWAQSTWYALMSFVLRMCRMIVWRCNIMKRPVKANFYYKKNGNSVESIKMITNFLLIDIKNYEKNVIIFYQTLFIWWKLSHYSFYFNDLLLRLFELLILSQRLSVYDKLLFVTIRSFTQLIITLYEHA